MAGSLTQKIVEAHLMEGQWKPGAEIGLRIDQTLTQDATGTMAYLQFETLGLPRVKTELSVSYIDHNTLQQGFENADDHAYLASVARRYGIKLSRAGNGICHQVHLERFGRPGATLLGSDSHTPTGGGLSMLAIGAGGLDVALAMAGKALYLPCPQVVQVYVTGSFSPWVSAKDLALEILGRFGTKGNVGRVFEYAGPGLASLSVPERATIANMGAECGVTATLFPSDAQTKAFLESQGRGEAYLPLAADEGALYEDRLEIDLSRLEPLAAFPHSPGNVVPVRELAGKPLDQVCLGSCTNSSYRDLATAAAILKGSTVPPRVSLVVTPGSRQVLRTIARDGHLDSLLAAGGRIVEPSCSFCIGNGHSPASGAVSLRSSNRNFEGRSGTADAQVFLVSPETAAASALAGAIADPRGLAVPPITISPNVNPVIDDSMIVEPAAPAEAGRVEIVRGPNIGAPPESRPLPADLAGSVAIKVGDKVTTDHIMPAGARMKYRSNIPAYSRYVFEALDPGFSERAAALRDSGSHNVIVAGASYGQGSSREHAAICPAYLGVVAVLAKGFERIHAANLVNFGVLPLRFRDEEDYGRLEAGMALAIPGLRARLAGGGDFEIIPGGGGRAILAYCELGERERRIVLAGGVLGLASRGDTDLEGRKP